MRTINWAFDALAERTSEEFATKVLVGEDNNLGLSGLAALEQYLVEDAVQEMEALIEEGRRDSRAFNDVVSGWPRRSKTRLAGYVYSETDIIDDDGFLDEMKRFASSDSKLDEDGNYVVPESDTLDTDDFVYEVNPFDDDELTDAEARLVIRTRLQELDESALDFDQVYNIDSFKWWLTETGDVEAAMKCHYFPRDIGLEIARQLKHPSHWGTLSPEGAVPMSCYECGQLVVHGEAEGWDEPTIISEDGRADGQMVEEGQRFFPRSLGTAQPVCGRCIDRARERSGDRVLHYRTANGDEVRIGQAGSLCEDFYHTDQAPTPFTELPRGEKELTNDLLMSRSRGDWYRITPQSDAPMAEVTMNIQDSTTLPLDLEGPFAFSFNRNNQLSAWFPANRPDAAQRLKDIMENGSPALEVTA